MDAQRAGGKDWQRILQHRESAWGAGNHADLVSFDAAPPRHDRRRVALYIQGSHYTARSKGRHALRRELRHRRRQRPPHADEFGARDVPLSGGARCHDHRSVRDWCGGRIMKLLPTTIVGSYPQPEWLIDRSKLAGRFPPRVRARELWRIAPEYLAQAQDDATMIAIRAQEDAGLDIVTDGEIRRESYSNRFATALDGVDIDNPGTALDRSGHPNPVPRVVGPIRRRHAVEADDVKFLRAHTDRTIKMTVPGPFTLSQQAQDDYYGSKEALAFAYAEAVNEEIRDLFAAGADIVQLDEPYLQARSAEAAQYGVKGVNRALDGVTGLGTTALHLCFGYVAIIHERPTWYSL